uniref:RxLR effector candidate protein n=1 Tax=Hyaloperonospora arabidopsidis (strain Emoy2) TaxID=559515 RepID=M4C4M8_HYAAE
MRLTYTAVVTLADLLSCSDSLLTGGDPKDILRHVVSFVAQGRNATTTEEIHFQGWSAGGDHVRGKRHSCGKNSRRMDERSVDIATDVIKKKLSVIGHIRKPTTTAGQPNPVKEEGTATANG